MKHKLLLLLSTLAALSCTKSGGESVLPSRYIEVSASSIDVRTEQSGIQQATQQGGIASRGVTDNNLHLMYLHFLRLNSDQADLGTFDFTGATPARAIRNSGENSPIPFVDPIPYDAITDHYAYVRGYYPVPTVDANNVATWTIDGKTDIIFSDVWNAGKYTAPVKVNDLTFTHILARLHIDGSYKTRDFDPAIQNKIWGKISKIEVQSYANLSYKYATNTTVIENEAQVALLAYEYVSNAFQPLTIPSANNPYVIASAMVPSDGSNTVKLRFTFQDSEITNGYIDLTANLTLKAGYINTLNVRFNTAERDIEIVGSSITPWGTGVDQSDDITSKMEATIEFGKEPFEKTHPDIVEFGCTKEHIDYFGTGATNGGLFTSLIEMRTKHKPYCKFEVAKEDLVFQGKSTMNWQTAQNSAQTVGPRNDACAQVMGPEWRLPRNPEMVLILANHDKLSTEARFDPLKLGESDVYWTSSEQSANDIWAVSKTGGHSSVVKSRQSFVRCVRELDE